MDMAGNPSPRTIHRLSCSRPLMVCIATAAGRSEKIETPNVKGSPITAYFWKAKHHLYLGTTAGFYRLFCSGATCTGKLVPEVKGPVVTARGVSDGSLWLGTWGAGLYRVTGERVESLSSRRELADDFVRTVSEDNEHNVWVGTRGGGLTRFRATALKPVGIPEGLNGNCASVAAGDGGNGVWLGTWRSGLYHWQNGVVHSQPLPQSPLGVLVTALGTNKNNDLWIGTFHNLWLLPHGQTRAKEVRLDSPDAPITHILIPRDGSLWLAKEGLGLFIFPSGDPRTSTPKQLLSSESVTALKQDRSGIVWIGTERGVWQSDGLSQLQPFLVKGSARGVTTISQDERGRIWMASNGRKVYVYDAGTTRRLDLSNLPPSEIFSIQEDGRGSVWFGTGRGLARGRMKDVDAVLASGTGSVTLTSYGVAEGMRTVECRCAKQPQSWTMPDGTLWVPTAKGFIQIDPSRKDNLLPPRPLIEEAILDGKPISPDKPIQLPPGDHELEARFTAIRLGPAEGVRFRYRLEGFEDKWIESGSQRIAHYSHLAPGKFRLLVAARDAADEWSLPTGISVEQRPHLYQRLWFRVALILAFAGAVLALFQLRLRVIRTSYKSVLEERNRIAREWHDTLLAGLSAVAWQVDAAVQVCSEAKVSDKLKEARGMLRYCRDEARRAIGDLRDDPANEPQLPQAIEEALRRITLGTEVQAELNVNEKLPRLPVGYGADLVRICQEATSNAMRHGHASRVTVLLDCNAGQLSLSVQDNGVGFASQQSVPPAPGHFGILGMRERAQKLGGTLRCSSEPGKGTVVHAVVPLPR